MPFMFDRAVLDDDDFVIAWSVAAGESDGHQYDWEIMDWKRRP